MTVELLDAAPAALGSAAVVEPVIVVVLPDLEFEGMLVAVPGAGAGHLVAIGDQMPIYAHLLAKACAQLLPLHFDRGGCSLALAQPVWPVDRGLESSGVQRFIDLLRHTRAGRPSGAAAYLVDASHNSIVSLLRQSMEAYFLARHIAHLCLGHHANAEIGQVRQGGVPLRCYHFSNEQLAEAEQSGLALLLATTEDTAARGLACWAVDVLFSSQAMVEALGYRTDEENALPDLSETQYGMRRDYFRGLLGSLPNNEQNVALMSRLDRVTNTCWRYVWESERGEGGSL